MLITQTPLRISFVGGGTDIADFYLKHGGEVISTAIDKYLYVIVKERYDNDIYINYSQKEIVSSVDEIKHDLVRESMRKLGITGGIEITFLADIPSHGSGLGSSSSVTVGLLNALYTYIGVRAPEERLAQEACEIEIDILNHPIGKQDQYIAAYGNLRHIAFNPDESVDVTTLDVPDRTRRFLSSNMLLFYTGITRKANAILAEQKRNMDDRIEYMLGMKALVPKMRDLLVYASDTWMGRELIEEFGRILHQGWMMKKELADSISNETIDGMYAAATKAGAYGGKLLGAGGGGFLLFVVPPESHEDVRDALGHLQEFPFDMARFGSKIVFNMRQA